MCEVITNSVFQLNIPESNYVKKWALTNPNPHTYQGLIDPNTNQYNGLGRIKYLSTSNQIQTYIGTFSQGKLTGSGTIWYLDGTIYKGQIVSSLRHGHGAMYGPNGKFQYDGVWANDLIDKPIYKATINSSGQIECQGFQVNGEYTGWVINHSDGQVSQIKFYQNNVAIKGFGKDGRQNYMINCLETSTISNQQAHQFLFDELPKLNKPEQLQQFLSNETNIKMLDEFSFDYDLDTGGYKQLSYKLFNDKGLYEIYQSDLDLTVRINANKSNVHIQTSSNLNVITGSLWSVHADKINSIKLVLLDNNTYGLEGFDCISIGQYTRSGSEFDYTYELNGQGLLKNGSKEYSGTFVSNKITEGVEKSNGKKIYEGKFNSSGKYHGVGTEWNTSGKIKYQGDFSNGKYHGNGSSYYTNAETEAIEYVGQWVSGYKHGQGTLFSVSGDEIFTGTFDHDQIA